MKRATLDRIEDGVAVLITGDREVHRPRADLPAEAREGDVIDLDTLQIDRPATDELRREVQEARARAKRHKAPPGDL